MYSQAEFDRLRAEFIPAADDNPEAIPYYRTFYATRELFGSWIWEQHHHVMHQACCTYPNSLSGIVSYVRCIVEGRNKYGRGEVKLEHLYEAEPEPRLEERAYDIFKRQYRTVFKGRRIPSNHSNEQWERVRTKALELAHAEYQEDLRPYTEKKARIDGRNARALAEAMECRQHEAGLENWLRDIEREGVSA